jgi:hypothetical protein
MYHLFWGAAPRARGSKLHLPEPRRPGFTASSASSWNTPLLLSAGLAVVSLAASCTGAISGTGLVPHGGSGGGGGIVQGGGGNGAGIGGTGGVIMLPALPSSLPTESACVRNGTGPRVLRRLTSGEFAASIADLFQDPAAPVVPVFNDPTVLGFSVDSNALLVQGLNADQLMTNAEAVAAWAVANHLSQVTGCSASAATCPASFIRSFGERAFRAPLSDSRVADYQAIFSAETAFNDGVAAVISAMLQSPSFLYRSEIGALVTPPPPDGTPVALTPYEVASSLSYLLTGSTPDATLLAAADAVAVGSQTVSGMIDEQAQRLLADPRSQDALMGFMTGWLGLNRLYDTVKDDTVFVLTNALRDEMASETRGLILDTYNNGGGFSDLLSADHSFLNKDLAQFYGFDTTGLGTAFSKVPYTASMARDGGILAHASILTGYARADVSSPTQRGHLVRTRLLCQDIPPPSPILDTTFKPEANPTTTRAHYEIDHSTGVCADCHKLMDKIGFGSEHYDAFGRRREMEGIYPIDATGTIVQANPTDGDVAFNGLTELQTYLAQSADLKQCMVRYWSYYAYGASSWDQDACTYAAIRQEATSGTYSLRSVLMAIVHAPHFTSRVQAP